MSQIHVHQQFSILEKSLRVPRLQEVADRIAFILVRDGIPREALLFHLKLDQNLAFNSQPGRMPMEILYEVAEFLGVSTDWLISGKGRNTREVAPAVPAPAYDQCAVVTGAQAERINVYNITK